MHRASVVRLAVTQFINTAVILLLVNASTGPTGTADATNVTDTGTVDALATAAAGQVAGLTARNLVCASGSTREFSCLFGPRGVLLRGMHFDLSPRWYAPTAGSSL